MIKVVNLYSGYANAQTGIGTVLKTLDSQLWQEKNISYKTISLDNGTNSAHIKSQTTNKKYFLKKILAYYRLLWWQLSEKNSYFAQKYIKYMFLRRAKNTIDKNKKILNEADLIFVNDIWSILSLLKIDSKMLYKCCYVNHSDGELAGFIKNVFPPIENSISYDDISKNLEFALTKIKHLVVLSEIAKKRVLEQYSFINDESITVIYNGYKCIREPIYPENKTLNLNVAGTLCSRKRQYLLISIVEKLKSENIHLNIYGDGPDNDKLHKSILKKNLSDKITMHGFFQEPFKNYRYGDIFILLSKKEGLPMAAVEAISVGSSLILTDAGGASEIISLTSGVLIDNKLPEDEIINNTVLYIKEHLQKETMRFEYAENSLKGYEKNFTDTIMINSYISLTKELTIRKP